MNNEGTAIEKVIEWVNANQEYHSEIDCNEYVEPAHWRIDIDMLESFLQSLLPAEKEQLQDAYERGQSDCSVCYGEISIDDDFDTFYKSIKLNK